MIHILVAESERKGFQHLSMLSQYLFEIVGTRNNKAIVRLPCGRMDTIWIISTDSQARGHRIDGTIFRQNNSFGTDELFFYVMRDQSHNNQNLEPYTRHWGSYTQDAFEDFALKGENYLFDLCLTSIQSNRRTP